MNHQLWRWIIRMLWLPLSSRERGLGGEVRGQDNYPHPSVCGSALGGAMRRSKRR